MKSALRIKCIIIIIISLGLHEETLDTSCPGLLDQYTTCRTDPERVSREGSSSSSPVNDVTHSELAPLPLEDNTAVTSGQTLAATVHFRLANISRYRRHLPFPLPEGDQLVDSLSFRRRRFVKARCISNAAAANERRAPSRRQGTRVGAGAGET
ncbi:hypothetical protein F2P81_011178 [Scophthalmus maximus]|uniref:Uncharacterized protein n=1 Tax=Scophthalmus maximus TaxID=52904 RepID=A0A6A4SKW6_SCOMX|nr:hypothetical protein F2P81_011178 [Scophthalmus maximus]